MCWVLKVMLSVKFEKLLFVMWCVVGFCIISGGSDIVRFLWSWRWCCSWSDVGILLRWCIWVLVVFIIFGIRFGIICLRCIGGEVY